MIKLALPKGRLQNATAIFLKRVGIDFPEYHPSSRSYRPKSRDFPKLFAKVFQEKDIAIQVAIGNYDLGICGLDWVQELLIKYPSDAIVKLRDLGYGRRSLYMVASKSSRWRSIEELKANDGLVRIVSEYPNLAESFALNLRLKRFQILPVWGAAEAYPPENADLALISESSSRRLPAKGLVPIAEILTSSAFLIANRVSLEKKDISSLLKPFYKAKFEVEEVEEPVLSEGESGEEFELLKEDLVSLALPDGHQQEPTMKFLKSAGLRLKGYQQPLPTRRPLLELDGFAAKVIRPQDMPLQVANGNFDLAITGRDWLLDHLCRFPSSPVEELADLGFGKVRIVAVVSNKLPIDRVSQLRSLLKEGQIPVLRLASEYVNLADKYARDNHLAPYKVIPTWGASEAFLPEDADVLIENTQTGKTLAKHNLKIIDTLFESSACLIANKASLEAKKEKVNFFLDKLSLRQL